MATLPPGGLVDGRSLVAALGLAAGLLLGGTALADAPAHGVPVHRVTLTAVAPGRAPTELTFEVAATDEAAASALARSAAAAIAPGLNVVDPPEDSVTAQWQAWPWKWNTDELPVRVAYNPSGAPPSVGPHVITAALDAWSSVPSSSFRFEYAGITENTATVASFGPDGENVVSWQSLDCSAGCVLGVTSKGAAHEVDMLLNSNPEAAALLGVGTKVDWRTVVLHELGHMAGLEHSCPSPFGPCTPAEADAVMFYQYRGLLRALAPDDVAGISALYPAEGATPSPTPTVPATPSPYPEYPIVLSAGWNLVAPPDLGIGVLTAGLPCLRAVYAYEGGDWRSWIRGAPESIQELATVASGQAYWMLAEGPCGKNFP